MKDEYAARVRKIVAFGGITTKHERIQDIALGVQLEPQASHVVPEADRRAMLKALRGKSAALKVHPLEGWLLTMPGRVVWES